MKYIITGKLQEDDRPKHLVCWLRYLYVFVPRLQFVSHPGVSQSQFGPLSHIILY